AQIESVIDIAPKITHIDSHHNFHRFDSLKDVYIRVAKRYGLAARGGNRKYCKRLSLQGVKSADYCESAWSRGEISAWNFLSLVTATFNELNDFAIVEIITHPGFFDCSLQTLSSLTNQRNEELKVLSSTDLIKQLGKQNIKLVSYEELNHR
ncbi:MAG: ChbG/HpnK family deacetylase, partial [bacterium]|nr:ChbG/HpnK family deacetylase [bacterium]